jgi:hypothetical protein
MSKVLWLGLASPGIWILEGRWMSVRKALNLDAQLYRNCVEQKSAKKQIPLKLIINQVTNKY